MQIPHRRTIASSAVALLLGTLMAPAQASPIMDDPVMHWTGVMTLLDPAGQPVANTSYPYYGDPTWGYGYRTQISGTLALDLDTGTGSFTVAPFEFTSAWAPAEVVSGTVQAIGDGLGGPGSLMLGNMLFNWNNVNGIPLSIVWDAAGLFAALGDGTYVTESISGVGALPASSGIRKGTLPIGPAPVATTSWNTTPLCTVVYAGDCMGVSPSGGFPLIADGIGGSPFIAGPFMGYSMNLDITSLHVEYFDACVGGCPPWPVPVPAAIWLFGSGLLGLLGMAGRSRIRKS